MTARKAASILDMNGLKITGVGVPAAASTDAARKVDVEDAQTAAVSRANHTGTQLAATISDFDTQVRVSRLDQLAAPTGSVGFGSQKITGLLDPAAAQDAATKNYVDATLSGVTTGQTIRGTVRAAATTNVNITTAPASIDGLTCVAGDTFLLTAQTTGSQNGPYTWSGTSTPMTRATNWDSPGEAVLGSYWIVREGTNADKFALLTNDAFTLGTTTGAFAFVGVATAGTAAVETDLGNGALTSFAVTHNFGTRAVRVLVYRVASPYDEVDVAVEHTDLNTVTLKPDAVWASNEFHAVVSKM